MHKIIFRKRKFFQFKSWGFFGGGGGGVGGVGGEKLP